MVKKLNKGKPKFPGKLETNQSDNTRVLNTEGRTVANSKLQDGYNKNEIIQYGTNKGKPYGFENQTIRGGMESLVTPDNVMMATGVGALAKAGVNAVGNKFLPNAYKLNPFAFKPNPKNYYHRSPDLKNIVNTETKMLQGFGQSEKGKAVSELAKSSEKDVINLKKPANNQLYFSKGTPLDYGRYNSAKLGMSGQGYAGPYIVEAEGIPMGASVKGRLPKATPPSNLEGYAVSQNPIPANNVKFYKEDWLKGYKEIPNTYLNGGNVNEEAGNRGMMKARMALDAHFGNPSAQRMVSPNPKTGMTPEGIGTHYMASMDNYAVPLLQDKGGNYLQYNSNPAPSSEDMRFESPEDAKYFAENYKNIAPMMRSNNFAGGGRVPIPVNNPNDPRLRAYNDSNSLYNKGIENEKFYIEHGMTKDKTHEFPFSKVTSYGYANKPKGKIQPISAISQETNPNHPDYYRAEFLKYKKPVQPYVYEKSKPVVEQPVIQENQFEPDMVTTVTPQAKTKLYQGYDFMQQTGLRPGDYTETQVQEAMKNKSIPKKSLGGRVLPKFSNNRIVKYPTGGDVFSNPELANALPDNSPVRIGNEDLYKNYKPQASEYIYEKEIPVVAPVSKMPALVNKTTAPSKAVKKAIKKEETTIENMSPVKKAMITNPAKAQTFQPLAADAQAVYEEKKKNPAWKNFKGNYSIYSKENSMLHLFDNKHNLLDQTRAGRGVGKGDAPNLANPKDWYDSNKPKKGQEQAIKNATTPAGAYAIKENPMNYNDYGTKTYKFGKPNQYNAQTAMHGIYKGDTYNRTKIINDPNIKQAYVSNGCLNIPAPFLNKNDAQINSGDSLFVTKEPKFATGGKVLPRFGDAGTVDTGAGITDYAGYAQMAMPIAHMLMPDQQVKDKRGNAVGSKMDSSYAAVSKGADWAAKAAVAGPVASIAAGVIGAGVGYFDNEDNNRKIDNQERLANDNIYNEDTSKAFNTNTGNFTQRRSTNTNIRFAAGGQVIDEDMGNPNAELELNETFRDPMTGETGMVDGPSHDNGGIEMSLAEGTQIWSDRLKHNGRTFASLTKPIINKIANIEKGLDTNPNSRFKQNSIKLLNAQLDFFFDIQESNKQQDEMKRTLKKQEGGVVDDMGNYHYANGGIYIKPENRGKFTAYKERTGKTTEEALHSENAHVRQMANFAKNAAGWKHADGGYVLPKFYEAGTFGDPETEPNLADIYKNPYKTPTSNVNGIKVFNNPYDKRQFMLDQLNPNKNQYKAFDPAMSIYKANQNADLAKEKNSLGAEMDQMNIASRGNTPITMGPMNRPEGYIDYTNVNIPETIQGRQLPNYSLQSPTLNTYTTPETVAPKATYARKPNGINYNNPEYVDPNFQMLGTTGRTNLPTTGAGPGGVNPALFNKANYSNGDYYMNHATPGGGSGSSADVTAAYEKQRSLDAKDQADMLAEEKSAAFKARIESYRNRGKIGQGVTAAISNQTQADRLKGLARPDKINNVNYLSSLTGPDLVNYGNQRNAIEQGASAVTDKAGRYLGNSGSIMATVNAANLQKQQQLAESYQGQENTNAGIMNQALAQKNQLSVAQAERNSAIEQENKANKYAYDAMIAAGLNSNDAITASQMGKMFGNDVSFGNDLERSRILGNKYAGKVWNSTDDNTIAANNSQLGEGKFGGVVGKLNKPMIKKGMPGKRSLKNK